ncbi:MAG: hypothetical protein ISR77_22875 [Pirellulaceae bacterium]|nr:hypothetical protein [Pirellulaceae bacterium]
MNRSYLRFVATGWLFVGTQEYWVAFLWRNDLIGMLLAILVLETGFFTLGFLLGKVIDSRFPSLRYNDLVVYFVMGLMGLILIEWLFVGNWPWVQPTIQLTMFTTWGGGVVFARMFTDKSPELDRVKRISLRYFLTLIVTASVIATIFKFINFRITFAVTYLAALFGYTFMNVFFIWLFVIDYRIAQTRQNRCSVTARALEGGMVGEATE